MGTLIDFVVADRRDARRVCASDCPSRDFDGLDAKGIDAVKLGTLLAILTRSEFDPSFVCAKLCSGGKDGPWVFEVPNELVQRLAVLTPRQLSSVGQEWAATEEFSPKYDNWSAEAVRQVLSELAALGRRAAGEGKAVLMWVCQ